MPDYNFWADLLDTWQASSDWIKALTILTPPASLLGILALQLWYRLQVKGMGPGIGTGMGTGAIHRQPAAYAPGETVGDPMLGALIDVRNDLQSGLHSGGNRSLPATTAPQGEDGQSDLKSRLRRIITDEYHRGSSPEEALRRARDILDRRNGD
ncbi:protein kinase [Rhizobium sp. FKY42]|uniref:protein kinase n=1 Tax=Rhizobium sp. FKY42 TaxID=2562310 RepID=UPI0010C0A8FC|nr:protein kinase [Rhizobium sp. FKY42]